MPYQPSRRSLNTTFRLFQRSIHSPLGRCRSNLLRPMPSLDYIPLALVKPEVKWAAVATGEETDPTRTVETIARRRVPRQAQGGTALPVPLALHRRPVPAPLTLSISGDRPDK